MVVENLKSVSVSHKEGSNVIKSMIEGNLVKSDMENISLSEEFNNCLVYSNVFFYRWEGFLLIYMDDDLKMMCPEFSLSDLFDLSILDDGGNSIKDNLDDILNGLNCLLCYINEDFNKLKDYPEYLLNRLLDCVNMNLGKINDFTK